jgi:hypothetical protein
MLVKIPRKYTTTVVAALAKQVSKLPEELRRSLSWDQANEPFSMLSTHFGYRACIARTPRNTL